MNVFMMRIFRGISKKKKKVEFPWFPSNFTSTNFSVNCTLLNIQPNSKKNKKSIHIYLHSNMSRHTTSNVETNTI